MSVVNDFFAQSSFPVADCRCKILSAFGGSKYFAFLVSFSFTTLAGVVESFLQGANMDSNFGTIQHAGKTLTLTQQSYLDCDGSNTGERYYSAGAVDSDGLEYKVRWAILDGFDGEDEGDACDWDAPSRIELRA